MTPASQIIERCGGFKAVAEWLGLERTAVQRWTYPHPKGTGERVPMKHWTALVEVARAHGFEVSLAEMMPEQMARMATNEAAQQDAAA